MVTSLFDPMCSYVLFMWNQYDTRAERFYRYSDILFPNKVSIFQPRVSIYIYIFFEQTLLKSQTLQLVKTQNINIIQNSDKLVHKNVI